MRYKKIILQPSRFLLFFCATLFTFSQVSDSSETLLLIPNDTTNAMLHSKPKKELPKITMPVYRMAPIKDKTIRAQVRAFNAMDANLTPSQSHYKNSAMEEIRIFPKIQFDPAKPPLPEHKELKNKDYILPSHEEYQVLKILWLKEDVMDTTIYTCVDTSLNLTMSILNGILETMHKKRLVTRKQVTPRFEFNAFGVPIEMSRKNLKNKVYIYHSSVDQTKLKHFINAAAYEVSQDSSRLKKSDLRATRQDATLLNELNKKSLID